MLEQVDWRQFAFIFATVFGLVLTHFLIKLINASKVGFGRAQNGKKLEAILKKYALSKNGFLPLKCLERLPKLYDEWENIATKLPELNRSRQLRKSVKGLKLIDCGGLEDESMLRRAYIILGMIVHSFVNGGKVPWERLITEKEKLDGFMKMKEKDSQDDCEGLADDFGDDALLAIPKQLAVPWYHVCRKLDLPFILTAAMDLWNWRLKDEAKPIDLSNLTTISSMTGTKTETYFHMVPCAMQAVAGPVVPKVFVLYEEIYGAKSMEERDNENDNVGIIEKELNDISKVLLMLYEVENVFKKFKEITMQIKHVVDKEIFYDIYRPLLSGFWPNGVRLNLDAEMSIEEQAEDDVEVQNDESAANLMMNDDNQSFSFNFGCQKVVMKRIANGDLVLNPKGPSAGQSTMVVLFDLLLGIQHKGSGKEFQNEMLNYMPIKHRKMIIDFSDLVIKHGSLRDFVLNHHISSHGNLTAAYNSCVQAVTDFRALHLGIAVKYLVRAQKGTGSSSFRDMLNEMVLSTKKVMVAPKAN